MCHVFNRIFIFKFDSSLADDTLKHPQLLPWEQMKVYYGYNSDYTLPFLGLEAMAGKGVGTRQELLSSTLARRV
jgi:hypothetical protein